MMEPNFIGPLDISWSKVVILWEQVMKSIRKFTLLFCLDFLQIQVKKVKEKNFWNKFLIKKWNLKLLVYM